MTSMLAVAVAAALVGGELRVDRAGRILFLGDSITQAGTYVRDVEGYLFTRFPDRPREVINLGLSSETASGLSEKTHPYPRPHVHERLARALEQARPDLVVACYGMNDGIYHPPDEARFAAYRSGIERLHDQATRAGASVVLATPFPFDARPIAAKTRPIGAEDYGFAHPFAGYDATLRRYADWLLGKKAEGWTVVDSHTSIVAALAEARRFDPSFAFAADGVHPDAAGHWLMAKTLLGAWGMPTEVGVAEVDARTMTARRGQVEGLAGDRDAIRFAWSTRVPMPHAPGWDRRPARVPRVADSFNVHRLIVTGLDAPRYALFEGDEKVGEADRASLAGGVDLLALPELSTNRRSRAIRPLLDRREELLSASWRSAVGHSRPGVAAGLPLDEARAKAAPIEEEIRRLARPVPVRLRLVPLKG